MKEGEGALHSIGEVSRVCKIPVKTLRYYDQIGLLKPAVRKESSKYRYYSDDQLQRVFIIRRLRLLGIGIREIQKLVEDESAEALADLAASKVQEIERRIDTLERLSLELTVFENRIRKGAELIGRKGEAPNIRREFLPEITLFGRSELMPFYINEEVNLNRWIEINEEARDMDQSVTGPFYIIYHTGFMGQFLSQDCKVEFSVQVGSRAGRTADTGGALSHPFGGFPAVTAVHIGDYGAIIQTYVAMNRWIQKHGLRIAGPATEEFIISPIDLEKKEEQVTRIILPVEEIE